jgi:hypothetical protein
MFAVSGANVLARIRRSRRRIVTLIHERVALARSGDNPTRVARLASGWVVLGDSQLLPGYCVLLSDPVVGSINELSGSERARFLADMVAIGDALLAVTDAYRINYEIQGNGDPACTPTSSLVICPKTPKGVGVPSGCMTRRSVTQSPLTQPSTPSWARLSRPGSASVAWSRWPVHSGPGFSFASAGGR